MGRDDPTFGLVVLEARHDSDALAAIGVATRSSAYTQDGSQPGQPVPTDTDSTWRPQVSRAQSVDLFVRTMRGGYAGRAGGAEIAYRLADDTASTDYRGWNDPNIVTGFSGGISAGATGTFGSSVSWTGVAACALPDGIIVLAAVDNSAKTGRVWSYDTRSGVWTDGATFSANAPGLEGPIGLVYDEGNDRVILYSGLSANTGLRQAAFYSTDQGATFSGFSRFVLGGSSQPSFEFGAIRVAYRPNGLDWLMITTDETDGSGTSSQFASSTAGASFDSVNASLSGTAHWPVWTGSHFLVAYVNPSTLAPEVRLLASARSDFADAAAIVVDSGRDAQVVVPVVDADGVIYLYATRIVTATVYEDLACYRSLDGGATWAKYTCEVTYPNTTTDWLEWQGACAAAGAVYLVGHGISPGSTSTDNVLGVLRLGGWSQVAHGPGALGTVITHELRAAWGASAPATTIESRLYYPIAYPHHHGWTAVATTTLPSLSTAGYDALYFNAGLASGYTWSYTATVAHSSVMFEIEAYVTAGATRAQALGVGALNAGASIRLSDNSTYEYEVLVHLCTDGIALQNANSGATIESIALTMNGTDGGGNLTWTRIRVMLTAGKVEWWYTQGTGDLAETWTKGTGGSVSSGAVATLDRVLWGYGATHAGTCTHAIRWVGVAFGGEWQHSIESTDEWEKAYSAGSRGHTYGKPVPGRANPYPVPELTADDEELGLIAATGGPTYLGETTTLATSYAWPIKAIHPTQSPSPRDSWRTTGDSQPLLVYDLDNAEWYGDGIALLALRARPHQWLLETDDGSTGWTTLGTLDLTVGSSLTYTRTGSVVAANGGTQGSRYFAENELAGGYVVSNSVAVNILANSAGFWGSQSATRQPLRITLASIGSFPSSGSDLRIVSPRGLLVVYPSALTVRRYVRISATASVTSPSSKYGAGILSIGRVLGLGAEPAWGWTRERRAFVRRSISSDGVSSARELGPPARRITYSWPEYQDTRKLREPESYVAISGGIPIGTGEDAAALPELLDVVDSGEVPVCVVPRLPTSSGSTLIGLDDFVYGRVVTDSLAITGKLGTEGTNEIVTVGALTVDELC